MVGFSGSWAEPLTLNSGLLGEIWGFVAEHAWCSKRVEVPKHLDLHADFKKLQILEIGRRFESRLCTTALAVVRKLLLPYPYSSLNTSK